MLTEWFDTKPCRSRLMLQVNNLHCRHKTHPTTHTPHIPCLLQGILKEEQRTLMGCPPKALQCGPTLQTRLQGMKQLPTGMRSSTTAPHWALMCLLCLGFHCLGDSNNVWIFCSSFPFSLFDRTAGLVQAQERLSVSQSPS